MLIPISGRQQEEYLLPKDLTLTLVAGYNVRLRKRIIDRWLELEGSAPDPMKALFAFLRSHRWIYSRQGSSDIAYQDKLATGLLEHKTTTVNRSDGSEKTATQVRVTPKGLGRLAREFPPIGKAVA